jgi:hypothetical protein
VGDSGFCDMMRGGPLGEKMSMRKEDAERDAREKVCGVESGQQCGRGGRSRLRKCGWWCGRAFPFSRVAGIGRWLHKRQSNGGRCRLMKRHGDVV